MGRNGHGVHTRREQAQEIPSAACMDAAPATAGRHRSSHAGVSGRIVCRG